MYYVHIYLFDVVEILNIDFLKNFKVKLFFTYKIDIRIQQVSCPTIKPNSK